MFKAKYFNKSSSSFKQLPKEQLFTTYQMNPYKLEVLIILRILNSINELTQVSLINIKNQLETLVRDDLRKFDQDYEKYVDFLFKNSSGEDSYESSSDKDSNESSPDGEINE